MMGNKHFEKGGEPFIPEEHGYLTTLKGGMNNMTQICDKCDRPMVRRTSKRGDFYGCTGYPECKNIVDIGKSDTPKVDSVHIKNEVKHDIVTTRADRPHSFEFGKAGARHKIYYNEVAELEVHMKSLVATGLAEEIGFEGFPSVDEPKTD